MVVHCSLARNLWFSFVHLNRGDLCRTFSLLVAVRQRESTFFLFFCSAATYRLSLIVGRRGILLGPPISRPSGGALRVLLLSCWIGERMPPGRVKVVASCTSADAPPLFLRDVVFFLTF